MAEDVFGIVGTVIAGAYFVESVVAEGGFGVVYRAHHGGFRAPVALKLLKVPLQNPTQQAHFLELFRAEAELLFRLSASIPNVVRALHVDAFTASDGRFVPYLVLEWLEGRTLEALILQRNREGLPALSLGELVRLLTPVARALERAHNFHGPEGPLSVVHRDLKPENLFIAQLADEEVVKILDFGIGKVKTAASQEVGRISQDAPALMAFTPAYGAPEQWAPRHYGQTGPWTDVWGLALCMVEALAARPLIQGDPATMMGITLDPQRRPTPRTEGVELPDAVEQVFARALALDPRERQRDAGVFWNELVQALQLPEAERGDARRRGPRVGQGVPAPSTPLERAPLVDLEFDPSRGDADWVPDLELDLVQPALQPASTAAHHAARVAAPAVAALPSSLLDWGDDGPGSAFVVTRHVTPEISLESSDLAAEDGRSNSPLMSPAAVGSGPVSASLVERRSVPRARTGSLARVHEPEAEPLWRRLRLAGGLLGAAVLVAVFDPIYAASTGEVLEIVGLRLSLFAGALLLCALGLGVRELVREH